MRCVLRSGRRQRAALRQGCHAIPMTRGPWPHRRRKTSHDGDGSCSCTCRRCSCLTEHRLHFASLLAVVALDRKAARAFPRRPVGLQHLGTPMRVGDSRLDYKVVPCGAAEHLQPRPRTRVVYEHVSDRDIALIPCARVLRTALLRLGVLDQMAYRPFGLARPRVGAAVLTSGRHSKVIGATTAFDG